MYGGNYFGSVEYGGQAGDFITKVKKALGAIILVTKNVVARLSSDNKVAQLVTKNVVARLSSDNKVAQLVTKNDRIIL